MTRQQTKTLLQVILLITGCGISAYFSLHAAGIMLLAGSGMLLTGLLFDRREKNELLLLCDEIDLILRGQDKVRLDAYNEGELGILTDAVGKMTVRLREQNSALANDKQFMKEALEDMAHQLRTPLTTSMLLLSRLRRSDLSYEERMTHVQELLMMLTRMQWMIDTMLGLSRLEAGALHFQPREFRVRELVRDALEPLGIPLELKNINVTMEITGEPVFYADKQFCMEALTNILKNCMEHTPSGGSITIEASANPLYAGLTVTDTGSGIAPEDLPHIFERFYRGKEFSISGYGIGLSFAQRIIAAQNGSLQVHNAKPHGAQFDWRMYRQQSYKDVSMGDVTFEGKIDHDS